MTSRNLVPTSASEAIDLVLRSNFFAELRAAYRPAGRDKILYDLLSLKQYLVESHETFDTGARVIEVGCGYGGFAVLMNIVGIQTIAGDGLNIHWKTAREFGAIFQSFDGRRIPFKSRSFDGAVTVGVLEHVGGIDDERDFLSEIRRVLKVDGKLLIWELPRHGGLEQGVSRLRGPKSVGRYSLGSRSAAHERFYDKEAVEKLLRSAGFALVRIRSYHILPRLSTRTCGSSTLMRVYISIDEVLSRLLPLGTVFLKLEARASTRLDEPERL